MCDYPSIYWDKKTSNYYYISRGDSDFINDLNQTPREFFQQFFRIINRLDIANKTLGFKNETEKSNSIISEIKKLIADGHLEKSLEKLQLYTKGIDAKLESQTVLISSQLKRLRKDKRIGLGEKPGEEARIILAILDILNDIEKSDCK